MPPQVDSPLIVVAGPTASGKSALALELAQHFGGEIVNCDSLQLYRGLDIGTAKTAAGERRGVPHHLFDILDPRDLTTAGDYAARARGVVRAIARRLALPVIVGGTGFYLRALLDGLAEGPRRDQALRARLDRIESRRAGRLHRFLKRLDPATAQRIHPNDVNKLVRAVEICLLSRRPAADLFLQAKPALEGFRPLKLVLDPERARLHERIAARTRKMFAAGLIDELRELIENGAPADAKAFESIGYHEAAEVLAGRLSAEQAIELTIIATRRYAKRQLTWFRRESHAIWIRGFGDDAEIIRNVTDITRQFLSNLQS